MSRPSRLDDIVVRGKAYADRGYCYDSDRSGDGPVIHTVHCKWAGGEWTAMSGHDCIRHGQDGAAIKADREARADARRFTPPEYRTPGAKPPKRKAGPIITAAQGQVVEVTALRGRPRTADGTGEWSTWETYTEVDPDYVGSLRAAFLHEVPRRVTKKEARAIVAEFTARVPGYEFQVVHAELRIKERVIA